MICRRPGGRRKITNDFSPAGRPAENNDNNLLMILMILMMLMILMILMMLMILYVEVACSRYQRRRYSQEAASQPASQEADRRKFGGLRMKTSTA